MEIFLLFDVFLLNLKKYAPQKSPKPSSLEPSFLRPSATGDIHARAAVTAQLKSKKKGGINKYRHICATFHYN